MNEGNEVGFAERNRHAIYPDKTPHLSD